MKTAQKKKDNELNAYTEYLEPVTFKGTVWPGGGKVQAELYGNRLSYIRNIKVEGRYYITTDRKGTIHYVFPSGLDLVENDGLCLYVSADSEPDYKIIAVKPYDPLRLECERL